MKSLLTFTAVFAAVTVVSSHAEIVPNFDEVGCEIRFYGSLDDNNQFPVPRDSGVRGGLRADSPSPSPRSAKISGL
jgi:hypothetical protein